MKIARIPRETFIAEYWLLNPGEHVAMIGPTGCGKTTLMFDILTPTLARHRDARGLMLVTKPHERKVTRKRDGSKYLRPRKFTGDDTVDEYAKRDGARIIRRYPAPPHIGGQQPPYDILWPKHTFNPDVDDANHYGIFRSALLDSYKRGNTILGTDEVWGLTAELNLDRELITLWTRARSMHTSVIASTQRPRHVPLAMYSQSTHAFLWYLPDTADRKRYAEFGFVEPKVIEAIVKSLGKHDCLYMRQYDKAMCIITA